MAETFSNLATSPLDGNINNSTTTIVVVDGSLFPTTGDFRIKIDDEIMICTARSGETLTVIRAQESTSAASHTTGTDVDHIVTAGALLSIMHTDEKSQDAVGNILTNSNTIDFDYNDSTPSISADVITQQSIASDTNGIKLSGDSSSPGNNVFYGTNPSGTRGWYDIANGIKPSEINVWDNSNNNRISLIGDQTGNSIFSLQDTGAVSTVILSSLGNAVFTNYVQATRFTSTIATGTAPLTVSSTTKVTNLNADLLDGNDASAFESAGSTSTHAALTSTHGVTGNIVGTGGTQTLTSKTIVVANNTITTAASGNLTSTELNAALAELQTDIDSRATASALAALRSRVQILKVLPPTTLFATEDIRLGGSSPVEVHAVWDFDPSTIEYMDFMCLLSGYGGNGLTFTLCWSATSATSGTCRWGIAIKRMAAGSDDADVSHTYDYNDVDATTAGAAGQVTYTDITFSSGSDMDDWADGEVAIVRVRRVANHANDTMGGDAELWAIYGKES